MNKYEQSLKQSDYQKEYYARTKDKRKANYNAQTQYLRYVEVKKMLNRLKKDIGIVNYDLILSEIEKLEKKKSN